MAVAKVKKEKPYYLVHVPHRVAAVTGLLLDWQYRRIIGFPGGFSIRPSKLRHDCFDLVWITCNPNNSFGDVTSRLVY